MLTMCLKLFASSVFVISCLSLHVHDKTLLLCIRVEQHNKKHNFPCTVNSPISFSVRLFVLGLHQYASLSACFVAAYLVSFAAPLPPERDVPFIPGRWRTALCGVTYCVRLIVLLRGVSKGHRAK